MKKIWMIEQLSRKIGTKKWSKPIAMYAYTSKEKAKLNIYYKKGIVNDRYLEYKHIISEYDLYDE